MCQMCWGCTWMLMNNIWMTDWEASRGVYHESVVSQSGKSAVQTSPLSLGWPLDQTDWLMWPGRVFFLLPHCRDEHPHWWRRTSLVCGWLGFKLGCQGMELRKQPELSATLAAGLHHTGDKNMDARGCNASLSSRVTEKTRALNITPEIVQSIKLESKTNMP